MEALVVVERLLIAALLVLTGVGLCRGYRWWNLQRVHKLGFQDPLLTSLVPGQPAIVYFTSDTCVACRTQQRPALARLQAMMSHVQIIQVNADQQLQDAERWGVMSLPTTFVLDGRGAPKAVNYGVASAEKLSKQIEAANSVN